MNKNIAGYGVGSFLDYDFSAKPNLPESLGSFIDRAKPSFEAFLFSLYAWLSCPTHICLSLHVKNGVALFKRIFIP